MAFDNINVMLNIQGQECNRQSFNFTVHPHFGFSTLNNATPSIFSTQRIAFSARSEIIELFALVKDVRLLLY